MIIKPDQPDSFTLLGDIGRTGGKGIDAYAITTLGQQWWEQR